MMLEATSHPNRCNRLILIDGNAILHRAFHALPPLTSPDGTVVNAVYGFASILFKIVNDLKPSHIAVCFDRAAPTFRKELYAGYQEKRPKMDDLLIPQVDMVHNLVRAFHIPIYEMDGFEADDLIGTITEKSKDDPTIQIRTDNHASDENGSNQVIIVTGDRDILQLVEDEMVYVYMPTKGLSEAKLYGEKEVIDRMGVSPHQIPDFKALAGDASDNYYGVDGIGPKTAVTLLTRYGSVENLYAALSKTGEMNQSVSEKVLEKLVAGKENAMMSHQLATIKRDVPIDVDFSGMVFTTLDTTDARVFIENLHFFSLLKRLTGETKETVKVKKKEKKKPEDSGEQLTIV